MYLFIILPPLHAHYPRIISCIPLHHVLISLTPEAHAAVTNTFLPIPSTAFPLSHHLTHNPLLNSTHSNPFAPHPISKWHPSPGPSRRKCGGSSVSTTMTYLSLLFPPTTPTSMMSLRPLTTSVTIIPLQVFQLSTLNPLHQTPPSTSIILTISTASQQLQPQSTQLMRPSHSRPASSRPGSPGIRKYAPFIYVSFRHIHRPCLLHFLLSSYRFSTLPTR